MPTKCGEIVKPDPGVWHGHRISWKPSPDGTFLMHYGSITHCIETSKSNKATSEHGLFYCRRWKLCIYRKQNFLKNIYILAHRNITIKIKKTLDFCIGTYRRITYSTINRHDISLPWLFGTRFEIPLVVSMAPDLHRGFPNDMLVTEILNPNDKIPVISVPISLVLNAKKNIHFIWKDARKNEHPAFPGNEYISVWNWRINKQLEPRTGNIELRLPPAQNMWL